MKISSSLFKKASAAEIFLNKLSNSKMKRAKPNQDNKNIIKVGSSLPRNNVSSNMGGSPVLTTQNVGSDTNSHLKRDQRRKSIEVLMDDKLHKAAASAHFRKERRGSEKDEEAGNKSVQSE